MAVYKAEVNKEQEKLLLQISVLLYKRQLIKNPTPYAVTKFALLNLIEGFNKIKKVS